MKDDYRFTYVTGTGSTTIKTGRGTLHAIIVGTTSAGKVEIFDGVDGGTFTQLGELKASIGEDSYQFDCTFANGLYITNIGGSKLTVVWR